MQLKRLVISGLFFFSVLLLAACNGTNTAPASSANSSASPNALTSNTTLGADSGGAVAVGAGSGSTSALEAQSIEGGNVKVKVTPLRLEPNAPLEFEITMDTHSVDLSDDMLKAVVLRDDAGMEYPPAAWEGPGGGGHHRQGTIKFAPLSTDTKSLTVIVKNIAGVPERVYNWDRGQ